MNDTYVEWLIKRKPSTAVLLLRGFLIFLCAIAFFFTMVPMFGIVGFILLVATGTLTYFVFRNSDVEFEYLYMPDQFSVDKIYGKARRKTVWECALQDIQTVVPTGSPEAGSFDTAGMKILDFSSQAPGVKTYTMIVRSTGTITKVIFEPSEKILQNPSLTRSLKFAKLYY